MSDETYKSQELNESQESEKSNDSEKIKKTKKSNTPKKLKKKSGNRDDFAVFDVLGLLFDAFELFGTFD
jgi:hypothetical protein